MSRFLSPYLSSLTPYTPGEQPADAGYLKLNTNESPFPPSPGVLDCLSRAQAEKLNLYSDPALKGLKRALAGRFRVDMENVFAGNGSDEVLALSMYAFGARGFTSPDLTYGFYPVLAKLFRLPYQTLPLDGDFRVRPEAYKNLRTAVVLANPNAPTGLCLSLDEIEEILRANPDNAVIVDEAYVEFGGQSAVSLLPRYEQLLVVGTFSKGWNLAGARLGYAVGGREIIRDLERVRYSFHPYNINRLSLLAGAAALAQEEYYAACRARVAKARAFAEEQLRALGFFTTDSRANFVFARPPVLGAGAFYEALRNKNILVRHLGGRADAFLRVTVGTRAQMEQVVRACADIIREAKKA